MDFLRGAGGFLRRGGGAAAQPDDVEQQANRTPEMEERCPSPPAQTPHRFSIGPPSRPTLFRSRAPTNTSTSTEAPLAATGTPEVLPDENEIESPKTPRFTLGLPTLPSTRLHLPHLTRTWTSGSNGPASRPPTGRPGTGRPGESGGYMPRPSFSRAMQERLAALGGGSGGVAAPEPALVAMAREQHLQDQEPPSVDGRPRPELRRFNGAEPAEMHLAAMVEDGRRRRRGTAGDGRNRERLSGEEERPTPKHFLFCFPWVRSRRVRSQILRCFVSGLFLTLLLAVYLALSITKNINNSELTVLLILVILFTTIFFCHGLIRLCMLVVRPRRDDEEGPRSRRRHRHLPGFIGPGGYAVPREPIRVVLARDEEAAGIESEAGKAKPPAYGLWRESVRVDPNRLFWQRNEEAPVPASRPATAAPRPPSYVSDDGIGYVVDAQPRSIAPTTDVPLPVHPSEIGRMSMDRPRW